MKYAVISSDANTDYLFYLPLTCFSWARLGFTPLVYLINVPEKQSELIKKYSFGGEVHTINDTIEGVKDSTLAQTIRLFAPYFLYKEDEMIIGDADMLIVQNIFKYSGEVVSYGFDLTGKSEIPMCYVHASVPKWKELMQLDIRAGVEEMLGEFIGRAKSEKWEDYWATDQQVLTARAREFGFHRINFVDRGHGSHGLPTGRWDRHCWDKVPDEIIDVHMLRSPLHEERWPLVKDMVKRLWPDDNWEWLEEYKKEFENI